jgi:hypothetical protein
LIAASRDFEELVVVVLRLEPEELDRLFFLVFRTVAIEGLSDGSEVKL